MNERITDAALELIKSERDGYSINRSLVREVLESYGLFYFFCFIDINLVELGIDDKEDSSDGSGKRYEVYRERFENKFLQTTEDYYEVEASNFTQANPLTEYMKKVEKRLAEEQERCIYYIHHVTENKLLKRAEKVENLSYDFNL